MGAAVEVGTHRADFACQIMRKWDGNFLYCVDPWTVPEGYEEQAVLLPGKGVDRELDMDIARRRLAGFGNRVSFVRLPSVEAFTSFADRSLDFVYIDGDHRYRQVSTDLMVWWRKIKKGGILAGHDFISRVQYSAYMDVQKAVMRFVKSRGIEDVFIVPELKAEPEFQPWSFYIVKP